MADLTQMELNQLKGLHKMLSQIAKKRTSFEVAEWEDVRELMPRKRATRGIQYEALEYLFDHLYEKVSEDELRDHFLKIKGRLQQKGDPVKSAINLAIKELQRLNEPKFDIIKIQEASLVGKTRRYVQLNFTGFDSVINYQQFCSYIEDMLDNEDAPIIRSIFNAPPDLGPIIFPGIKKEWLRRIQAFALINSSEQIDDQNPKTLYYFIPESQTTCSFLLLYERHDSEFPFIAFVSDTTSVKSIEESQYIVYRGAEKLPKLKFYHNIWTAQKNMALDAEEVARFWRKANEIAAEIGNKYPQMTPKTIFKGLIAAHIRENRQSRIEGEKTCDQ